MATDWTEWSAIFTAVAAGATAIAAGVTAAMAHQTKRDADASVSLVREAQRDRALAYRPVLAVDVVQSNRSSSGYTRNVLIRNVGAGPALGCIYVAQEDGQWCMTPLTHIAAGAGRQVRASDRGLNPDLARWTDAERRGTLVPEALFCRDVFNNRYRFLVDSAGDVLPSEMRPAEDCKGTAGGDWWTDVELWGMT